MYVGPMSTNSIATGEIRVIFDPILALQEFIVVPMADKLGIPGEEIEVRYDVELIFSVLTEYDSINGREGFRLRADAEDNFWTVVAAYEI